MYSNIALIFFGLGLKIFFELTINLAHLVQSSSYTCYEYRLKKLNKAFLE